MACPVFLHVHVEVGVKGNTAWHGMVTGLPTNHWDRSPWRSLPGSHRMTSHVCAPAPVPVPPRSVMHALPSRPP